MPAIGCTTTMLPLAARVPAQASEAKQVDASVVDQVSVAGCPAGTLAGARDRLTVGIGVAGAATMTDALFAAPLQVRV